MKIDSEAAESPSRDSAGPDDLSHRERQLLEALDQAQAEIAQLKIALESNRTIGAACGILMAALHVNQEEAFSRLRAASQANGRKLIVVANDVLFTGALLLPETKPPSKARGI